MMSRLIFVVAATSALLAGSLTACAADANTVSGTVVRVVDGDTVVVSVNNAEGTIRLLNIDTPETKDPNQPVECLGPEAADYLREALPTGSPVRLAFDAERQDRFGRTLAAVFSSSGALVNAEIARRGLGIPVVVGANKKFLPPVEEAHNEARESKVGLFSESVECTLPAQLAAATGALAAAENPAPVTTSAGAGAAVAALASALATAKAVQTMLSVGRLAEKAVLWAAFSAEDAASKLAGLTSKISRADKTLTQLKDQQQSLAAAEKKAEEERIAATARAAAEKEAADDAAAAEKARTEAEAAEAERLRNLPAPAPYVPPVQQYVPPVQQYVPPAPVAPADPYPGYTGPRCYAPGGKTWRPC